VCKCAIVNVCDYVGERVSVNACVCWCVTVCESMCDCKCASANVCV
jgi:hypothetical protein